MSQNKKRSREKARNTFWSDNDRRTYECPDCGRRETQLRTGFEVHHIDGDHTNNRPSNLIGLCRACHNLREDKKPSLSEIQLMQEQIQNRSINRQTTPIVKTKEEALLAYKSAKDACKPHMVIAKIHRRKYTQLKIDFNTAEGWYSDDDTPGPPRLTKEAVEIVDAIMRKYRGNEKPRNATAALSTTYDTDIIHAPPLLPDVTRRLSTEIRPIIMNEENWEPSKPRI